MRRLSTQLLVSHLLLVLLMGFVMGASIKALLGLSGMVGHMVDHNLRSITSGYKIADAFQDEIKAASQVLTNHRKAADDFGGFDLTIRTEIAESEKAADSNEDVLLLNALKKDADTARDTFGRLTTAKSTAEARTSFAILQVAARSGADNATRMALENEVAATSERQSIADHAVSDSRWSISYTFLALL